MPEGEQRVRAALADLASPDRVTQVAALEELRSLGPRAAAAVPALLGLLVQDPGDVFVLVCLAEIGEPAVPALSGALADAGHPARVAATDVLARLGPAARAAIPRLVAALVDPACAANAALALARIGAAAVPALRQALHDPHEDVRDHALFALGEIGSVARAAIPDLLPILRDADPSRRIAAARAAGRIDAETTLADARPVLEAFVRDGADPDLRLEAFEALGGFGPAAREAVPLLLDFARRGEGETRVEAAVALARVSPGAATLVVVPILVDLLEGGDLTGRARAAQVLGDMGLHAETAVPALAKVLDGFDEDVAGFVDAAGALVRIGGEGHRLLRRALAVPRLQYILGRGLADTWEAGARFLRESGADPDEQVRLGVARVFGASGRLSAGTRADLEHAAREAPPALRVALDSLAPTP